MIINISFGTDARYFSALPKTNCLDGTDNQGNHLTYRRSSEGDNAVIANAVTSGYLTEKHVPMTSDNLNSDGVILASADSSEVVQQTKACTRSEGLFHRIKNWGCVMMPWAQS